MNLHSLQSLTSDIFIGEYAKFQRKNRERGRRVQRKVPRLLTHLESLQVEKQHLQTLVMVQ
jgi:hypothetical protein